MDSISIRQVEELDLPMLQQISRQTFEETFAKDNTPEDMQDYLEKNLGWGQLKTQWVNPESRFFLAYLDEQPVGYLKINLGDAQSERQGSHAMELERIYVLKAFQGQRIGQALLDHTIQLSQSEQMKKIWLGVWEHNLSAISFYEKNGFKPFGQHKFQLGNDLQTDILMQLEIEKH